MSERLVRVAVVGDAGVGKTSLITSAVTDTFSSRPPPTLPDTRIPANKYPENVPMLITDTSSRPEDKLLVEEAVKRCDAVVLCFDSRRETMQRIRSYWLPELHKIKASAPVILVCCRLDEEDRREIEIIREMVEPIVREIAQVEVCINCSARCLRRVQEVFYLAIKAVLYPVAPLYNRIARQLTGNCTRALKRVFLMCDIDQDNALSDEELNLFQEVCFSMPLSPEELRNVCLVVQEKMTGGVNERGLTLGGFLFINCLFIERGRLESTWAIMRKFGYNDDLTLSDYAAASANFHLPDGSLYELSPAAESFLLRSFTRHDADDDGLLTFNDIEAMFNTSPNPIWQDELWQRTLVHPCPSDPSQPKGSVNWPAFLTRWRAYMLLAPRRAFEQLLYMGFNGPLGDTPAALLARVPRQRRTQRTELLARRTVHCYCFGAPGSGRTTLLKALAGLLPSEGPADNVTATAEIPITSHRAVTVLATEVSAADAEQLLGDPAASPAGSTSTASPDHGLQLSRCDVAVFVFDSSSAASLQAAVQQLVRVAERVGDGLPCVLVAAKDDLSMSKELQQELAARLADLHLPEAPTCSALEGNVEEVFRKIAIVALQPEAYIPDTPAKKVHRALVRRACFTAAGLALGGLTGYCLYRGYKVFQAQAAEGLGGAGGQSGGRAQVGEQYTGLLSGSRDVGGHSGLKLRR